MINRIVEFKNSPTTKNLREYYSTNSLMGIYDINRKEIRHTSFLKWLFDKETAISELSLRKLLDVIVLKSSSLDDELQQLLTIGNYDIEDWKVIENHSISQGLVDLYIDLTVNSCQIEIIIENKVYSSEYDDQTQKYFDYFTNNNEKSTKIFLYLTPISSLELDKLNEPECCCKGFTQINYQLIVDSVIEPILENGVNQNIEFILKDYLKALSTPVKIKQEKFKNMAISNKENELLIRFWEENEDLILKAVEATRDNSHIEPEKREVARKISELLNNKEEKVGAYVKRNLMQLFEQNKISNQEVVDFQDAGFSKRTFDIQYPLLKKVLNSKDKPLHYWKDTVSIYDEQYYICCKWFEWFEKDNNNDRVYFDKWLKTKLI